MEYYEVVNKVLIDRLASKSLTDHSGYSFLIAFTVCILYIWVYYALKFRKIPEHKKIKIQTPWENSDPAGGAII